MEKICDCNQGRLPCSGCGREGHAEVPFSVPLRSGERVNTVGWFRSFRFWLIKKLAAGDAVMVNASIGVKELLPPLEQVNVCGLDGCAALVEDMRFVVPDGKAIVIGIAKQGAII